MKNNEPHGLLPEQFPTPVCAPDVELSVISSLMISSNALVETLDVLDAECFYNKRNREVYEAIMRVYNSGDSPDMMLVSNDLSKNKSEITPLEVSQICMENPVVRDLRPHALILKDYSLRRKLFYTACEMLTQSTDLTVPVDVIHGEAKKRVDSLFDTKQEVMSTLKSSYQILQQNMLINMNMNEGETFGTPTGFPHIDRKGGLVGSNLIIVGAETSQGKTSFATALALSAIEHGDKVAFYSLEMSSVQLTARIASMKSGIPSSRIMFEKITLDEIYRIDYAMESFNAENMFFDEKSTMSLSSVLMSIRMMKLKHDIKGVIVDYLQLVNTRELGVSREQSVAQCARDLKNLAKELGIWIIAISQLSRNQSSPVPSMARLRDSGQIEEAADSIYLIYRPRDNAKYPEPFEDISTNGTAMVIEAKGRNSGTGEFICGFRAANTQFYPMDQAEVDRLRGNFSSPVQSRRPIDEDVPF